MAFEIDTNLGYLPTYLESPVRLGALDPPMSPTMDGQCNQ